MTNFRVDGEPEMFGRRQSLYV